MNTTFAHLDGHRKMEARVTQRLEMHPPTPRPAASQTATACACGTIAGRFT